MDRIPIVEFKPENLKLIQYYLNVHGNVQILRKYNMKITFKELEDILDGNSEIYEMIGEELIDVDDHGDSTKEIYFKNKNDGTEYDCTIFVQKEWGLMEQDSYEIYKVKQITVIKRVRDK
jgi:hypothetical protein